MIQFTILLLLSFCGTFAQDGKNRKKHLLQIYSCLILIFLSASLSKLMIVNGDPIEESQVVEVIDLENPAAICFNPAPYPSQRTGSVATFIEGQVLVCGGYVKNIKQVAQHPDKI